MNELGDGGDHHFGLIAVRRMPAVGQFEQLRLRHQAGDAANLFERAGVASRPWTASKGQPMDSISDSIDHCLNGGSSQMRFQRQNAESGSS